jgi:hypothetical protein
MDPQNGIADERDRRKSMAQLMLGLADDFEAEYHGDKDLNPINLPGPANEEQEDRLAAYYSVAELGGASQPRAEAPHEGTQPANAQGDQKQLVMNGPKESKTPARDSINGHPQNKKTAVAQNTKPAWSHQIGGQLDSGRWNEGGIEPGHKETTGTSPMMSGSERGMTTKDQGGKRSPQKPCLKPESKGAGPMDFGRKRTAWENGNGRGHLQLPTGESRR